MIPDEIVYGAGDIEINAGDRAVQVGSHVYLPQANAGPLRRGRHGAPGVRGRHAAGRRHDRDSLLRHRVELGAGSLADDHLSAPRAAINELRYPATRFEDAAIDDGSTVLALAGGGTLITWQAARLVG